MLAVQWLYLLSIMLPALIFLTDSCADLRLHRWHLNLISTKHGHIRGACYLKCIIRRWTVRRTARGINQQWCYQKTRVEHYQSGQNCVVTTTQTCPPQSPRLQPEWDRDDCYGQEYRIDNNEPMASWPVSERRSHLKCSKDKMDLKRLGGYRVITIINETERKIWCSQGIDGQSWLVDPQAPNEA